MTFADEDRTRWFLRCILPHEPALHRWLARRRTLNIDPNDIIQEAYSVLAARERVDDISHPRAYLFQIAHSLVVRHVRRARIVSFQALDDLAGLDPADDLGSPEETLVARDELRRLATLIAALPGKTREAFILRRVHGLSQREIAGRMRISESTVEKHIARALRILIDRFRHGGNDASQVSREYRAENRPLDVRSRNQS